MATMFIPTMFIRSHAQKIQPYVFYSYKMNCKEILTGYYIKNKEYYLLLGLFGAPSYRLLKLITCLSMPLANHVDCA